MKANAEDPMKSLVEGVWKQLKKNKKDWEPRYAGYIKRISSLRKKERRPFNTPKPFSLYGSIGTAENCFTLRFAGQTVAELTCDKKGVWLTEQQGNGKYFGREVIKGKVLWNSPEAKEFRRFFSEKATSDKAKSKEHHIENRLLDEFSKPGSAGKLLANIQPVKLHKRYFQMPVPLRASDHSGDYIGRNSSSQGHIDILARVGRGKNSRLCVMEIKDENKPAEPQKKAMEQALIYATFIVALIRSKSCGAEWWDFFENHEVSNAAKSKEHLDIDVVTVMPEPEGKTNGFTSSVSPDNKELNCTFNCHTLYFNENDLLKGKLKEFTGTYPAYLN